MYSVKAQCFLSAPDWNMSQEVSIKISWSDSYIFQILDYILSKLSFLIDTTH